MSESRGTEAGALRDTARLTIDEVLERHFSPPTRAGDEDREPPERVERAMREGLERYFTGINRDAAWEEVLARAGKTYEVVERQRRPDERGAGTFDLDIWVIADLVRSLGLASADNRGHREVAAAIADSVLAWSRR